jgi:hypothetical protein
MANFVKVYQSGKCIVQYRVSDAAYIARELRLDGSGDTTSYIRPAIRSTTSLCSISGSTATIVLDMHPDPTGPEPVDYTSEV